MIFKKIPSITHLQKSSLQFREMCRPIGPGKIRPRRFEKLFMFSGKKSKIKLNTKVTVTENIE
jgi:hypothetical protein